MRSTISSSETRTRGQRLVRALAPVVALGTATVGLVTASPATAVAQTTQDLVSWGYDAFGQSTVPSDLTGVTAIAGGHQLTLALKADGTVETWGAYLAPDVWVPVVPPVGLSDVTAVAGGVTHSLALRSDGTVVGWGDNTWGEVTMPTGLTNATAVAAGYGHSLALTAGGAVIGWGRNDYGAASVPPAAQSGVTAISTSYWTSLALKNNGTVVGWGSNAYGQASVPSGLSDVTAIAAGSYHSLALKSDGTVVAWGRSDSGQIDVPAGLTDVVAIAAGHLHSYALKSDGTIVGWGNNEHGQLDWPANLRATALASGGYHGLALGTLDETPPDVTVTSPIEGASFRRGDTAVAQYDCQDAGTGLASCLADVDGVALAGPGSVLPTDTVGVHVLTVTATDNGGLTTSVTRHYTVFETLTGPAATLPTVNVAKAGSAVPVGFSLDGYQGLSIFADGYPATRPISCTTWTVDPEDQLVPTASTPAGLHYSALNDQYTYAWRTPKAWSGTCRQLVIRFADDVPGYGGAEVWFNFRFR